MHRVLCLLIAVAYGLSGHGTSYGPPPLPPVNWEASSDKRFDPPVEEALIELSKTHGAARWDKLPNWWAQWSVDALEPLGVLMDKPEWEPFLFQLVLIYYACPFEEGLPTIQKGLLKAAEGLLPGEELNPPRFGTPFQLHLEAVKQLSPTLLEVLLSHDNPQVRYDGALTLIRDTRVMPPAVAPVLEAFAASEAPLERRFAVGLLNTVPSPENHARAVEIAATVSEEFLEQIRVHHERMQPYLRAREPMALILEKEGQQ